MGCCGSCSAPVDVYPENIDAMAAVAAKTFRVLVGPVVGTVDSSGGRILLETNLPGMFAAYIVHREQIEFASFLSCHRCR